MTAEEGHPESGAAGPQRHHHHRVGPELRDPGGPGVLGHPSGDGRVGRPVHGATARGQTVGGGRQRRIAGRPSESDRGLRASFEDRPHSGTAHGDRPRHRSGGRLVAARERFQQVDDGEVGEPGDGYVGQLLRGAGTVQGGADADVRGVRHELPGVVTLRPGPVVRGQAHGAHLAVRIPQRGQRSGPGVLRGRTRGADEAVQVLGLTGLQHQAHPALGLVAHGIRRDLRETQPAHLGLREGERALHTRIGPDQPQVRIEDRQEAGGLGERPFLQRLAPGCEGLARHGGDHEPLGGPAGGRPAVREQCQLHPPAVPVPQCHGAAPPLLPGREPPCRIRDAVGEQVGGGQSHDLGGQVAEQPTGILTPLGHDAVLADGGRGRVRRSGFGGGVRLLRPLTGRGGKSLHRHSSRPR